MTRTPAFRCVHQQSGVVLVVGLLVLLILSLLAVGSMRSTTLEERMTSNTQDQQIAFQLAEAALREAETILSQPMLPSFVTIDDVDGEGFYLFDPPDEDTPANAYKPLWKRAAADARSPQWREATANNDAPPAPIDRARAEFLIEQLLIAEELSPGESLQADGAEDRRERIIYRITARAWGAMSADQNAPTIILQSTFKR